MEKPIQEILSIFVLVQLISLGCGAFLLASSPLEPRAESTIENVAGSVAYFLWIMVGAAIMLLIVKYYSGVLLFRVLEAIIIFFSSWIVFSIFIAILRLAFPFIPQEIDALLSLITILVRHTFPSLRNSIAILTSAGIGALFGSFFSFVFVTILGILLSLYDYIAVFITKHMLLFAQRFSRMELVFSVSSKVPSLSSSPSPSSPDASAPSSHSASQVHHIELGSGDLVVPAMITTASYQFGCIVTDQHICVSFIPLIGFFFSGAVLLGGAIGLFFVLSYVYKKQTFLPALPPIVTGQLISFFLAYVLFSLFRMVM